MQKRAKERGEMYKSVQKNALKCNSVRSNLKSAKMQDSQLCRQCDGEKWHCKLVSKTPQKLFSVPFADINSDQGGEKGIN